MKPIAIALLTIALWGCTDADPAGVRRTQLGGEYYFEQLESGALLLMRKGHDAPAGYVEGTVLQWRATDRALAVWRRSAYMRDGERLEPDAWYVIERSSHHIDGPLTEAEFRSSHPTLSAAPPGRP